MLELVQIGLVWQNRFCKHFFGHEGVKGAFRFDWGVKNLSNFVQHWTHVDYTLMSILPVGQARLDRFYNLGLIAKCFGLCLDTFTWVAYWRGFTRGTWRTWVRRCFLLFIHFFCKRFFAWAAWNYCKGFIFKAANLRLCMVFGLLSLVQLFNFFYVSFLLAGFKRSLLHKQIAILDQSTLI